MMGSAWMNLAPPKVEFFLWLALLDELNTKDLPHRKGIILAISNVCTFCSSNIETQDHLLVNCSSSWRIWCNISTDLGQQLARPSTFWQSVED